LGINLRQLFETRPVELIQRSEKLQQLLQSIDGPTPYFVDISSLNKSLQPNTFRMQDGVVESYDENEVTVIINNPIGVPMSFIADINKSLYTEFITEEN